MSVYVDELIGHGGSATFKWKESCHMFADTLEELHLMATKIGLKREWFQISKAGFPHYDLNANKRNQVLRYDVIIVRRGPALARLFQRIRLRGTSNT